MEVYWNNATTCAAWFFQLALIFPLLKICISTELIIILWVYLFVLYLCRTGMKQLRGASYLPCVLPSTWVTSVLREKNTSGPLYALALADRVRHNRFKGCIHQNLFVLLNCMLCKVQKCYAWCSCWILTDIALISHCLLGNYSHVWWAPYNDESYDSFFMLHLSNVHEAVCFCFK